MATGDATGDGLPAAKGDPQATADSFGNIYLTYITMGTVYTGTIGLAGNGNGGANTAFVVNSRDGPRWASGEWVAYNLVIPGAGGAAAQTLPITRSGSNFLGLTGQLQGNPALLAGTGFTIQCANPGAIKKSVVVVVSTNGGATFRWLDTRPQVDGVDYPAITTGVTSCPGFGTNLVWLVYAVAGNGPAAGRGLWSSWASVAGAGQIGEFSNPAQIAGSVPTATTSRGTGEEIAIGPTGTMMVAWDQGIGAGTADNICVATSNDYQTFANPAGAGNYLVVTTTNVSMFGGAPFWARRCGPQGPAEPGRTSGWRGARPMA
jgi:hypothetical protein